MGVKIKVLGSKGHETIELPVEEAEKLVYEKGERYFVVDSATKQIISEVKLEEGQEIALIPKVGGG